MVDEKMRQGFGTLMWKGHLRDLALVQLSFQQVAEMCCFLQVLAWRSSEHSTGSSVGIGTLQWDIAICPIKGSPQHEYITYKNKYKKEDKTHKSTLKQISKIN